MEVGIEMEAEGEEAEGGGGTATKELRPPVLLSDGICSTGEGNSISSSELIE